MPKCAKCGYILPPQFMEETNNKEHLCRFCIEDKTELRYKGSKTVTRKEIADEYIEFLKIVREKNDILKDVIKGDVTNIPEKLIV